MKLFGHGNPEKRAEVRELGFVDFRVPDDFDAPLPEDELDA